MNSLPTPILIVGPPPDALKSSTPVSGISRLDLEDVAGQQSQHGCAWNGRAPVVVTDSAEQAIAHAQAQHPYLVILSGEASKRIETSQNIARQIRQSVQPEGVTIVALTPSSELSWDPNKDNPEIDGFFVEPLSADILRALNESAFLRRRY